jgi:putative ABC transport system substrate-binding protein
MVLNSPNHKPRRAYLCALAVVVLLVSLATATAQAPRVPRIGILSGQAADKDLCLERLRQGLSGLDYVEGKTHVLEVRRSEGRQEPLPRLAGELVGLKVMAVRTYPVEQGLVSGFARPGGNITGLATFTPELMAKLECSPIFCSPRGA